MMPGLESNFSNDREYSHDAGAVPYVVERLQAATPHQRGRALAGGRAVLTSVSVPVALPPLLLLGDGDMEEDNEEYRDERGSLGRRHPQLLSVASFC